MATGTWKRRMWSWDSRSGVTMEMILSREGLGVKGRDERSWVIRVVGRADSVEM